MNSPLDSACMVQLDQVLARFGIEDPAERSAVVPYCKGAAFEAGEHLHEAGTLASQVFFLCSGLARLYYLVEDGREFNKSFSREDQFVGALQYSENPAPVRYFIQALEPTQTVAISLQGLKTLFHESLPWANLGRRYMEALAVRKAEREGEFLLDSAEQRYSRFLQQEPELAGRLPLYHVASYLGITDVALSRIRRRLK